jgi:hypothetical protein
MTIPRTFHAAAMGELADNALVDELFLATLSRFPVVAERTRLRTLLVDTPNAATRSRTFCGPR